MPPSAHGRLNGRGGWCLPNHRHQLVKRQAAGVIPCDDAVAGNRSDRRGHYGYHCAHVAVGFIEGVAHLVDAPSRVHYGTFKPLLIRAGERHAEGQEIHGKTVRDADSGAGAAAGTPVAAPGGVRTGVDPHGHPPALRPADESDLQLGLYDAKGRPQ